MASYQRITAEEGKGVFNFHEKWHKWRISTKKSVRNQVVLNFNLDSLIPQWPQGKEIAQAKVDDIKSVMHLIPADCHDFYNTIKGNINIVDDIDGIHRPDFEIELQV